MIKQKPGQAISTDDFEDDLEEADDSSIVGFEYVSTTNNAAQNVAENTPAEEPTVEETPAEEPAEAEEEAEEEETEE